MEHVQQSYRSLSLLMNLNWDRLLYGATIAFALSAGAYLGTLLNWQGPAQAPQHRKSSAQYGRGATGLAPVA